MLQFAPNSDVFVSENTTAKNSAISRITNVFTYLNSYLKEKDKLKEDNLLEIYGICKPYITSVIQDVTGSGSFTKF